jgi:hypothetical protein
VTLTSELHEIERFPSIAIRMRRIFRGIIVNVSEYYSPTTHTRYDDGSRASAAANYVNTGVPQYISKEVPSHLNYAGVGYSRTPPGSEA